MSAPRSESPPQQDTLSETGPAPNITLGLSKFAAEAPERPALAVGARQLSYRQLDAAVWAAAGHFDRHGVSRGDVLPLYLSDQISLAVALLGAMRMGATPMVLSTALTDSQRQAPIRQIEARFQVVSTPGAAEAVLRAIPFDWRRLPDHDFGHLLDPAPEQPAKITIGSGSTGQPLLMPVSHRALHGRNASHGRNFSLRPGLRFMNAAPLFFAMPISLLIASLSHGVTCLFPESAKDLGAAVEAARPESLHLTVLHAQQLLAAADAGAELDLSRLERMSIGASPASEGLRAALRDRLKVRLAITYGANEAGSLCLALPEDLDRVADTVGTPWNPDGFQIVDADDRPLGDGDIGQIRLSGPGVIDGYVGGVAADRFRDGWFYPGDLAKWQDGLIVHCGRADQMMIMDGINVYPAEIERALERHPAVDEAAAFPLPHRVHGSVPVCAVTLKPGARPRHRDLMAHAHRELGAKYPRRLLMVDRLPRNPQGKLIRRKLVRAMLEAEKRGLAG